MKVFIAAFTIVVFAAWGRTDSIDSIPVESCNSQLASQQDGCEEHVWRLGFGSCHQQQKQTPIFDTISKGNLNAFAFLGDNVYNDEDDCASFNNEVCDFRRNLEAQYRKLERVVTRLFIGTDEEGAHNLLRNYGLLGEKLRRSSFLEEIPAVIATYDDHDYGWNDAGGAAQPWRSKAVKHFKTFWSSVSPLMQAALERQKEEVKRHTGVHDQKSEFGVFTSHEFGTETDRLVRVVMLDTRYDRTALNTDPAREGAVFYIPNADPQAHLLSEAQWQWLQREVAKPAALLVLGSSTQVLRQLNGGEHWGNFPLERERLISILTNTSAVEKPRPVLIISGDIHHSELSAWPELHMYDATSSGLTETWNQIPDPNSNLVDASSVVRDSNFGVLEVDWEKREVEVSFRDELGHARYRKALSFADITPI